MNKAEASSILYAEILKYRAKSYSDLLYLLERQDCFKVIGSAGVIYQLEIQAFWDACPHGVLRVHGSIDDRGLRSFFPLGQDFLISPNGQLIEE